MQRASILRNAQSPRKIGKLNLGGLAERSSRVGSLANNNRYKPIGTGRAASQAANFCPVHSRSIELFCRTCSAYLCSECTVFSDHFQHKIVTSQEADTRAVPRQDRLAAEVQAVKIELAKRGAAFTGDWQTRKTALVSETNSFFGEIVRRLEARRAEANRQVGEFFSFLSENFQQKRAELEQAAAALLALVQTEPQEQRFRLAHQIDLLKRQAGALTFDHFSRQKLCFVAKRDWRETLEGLASLENQDSPVFNRVWLEHLDLGDDVPGSVANAGRSTSPFLSSVATTSAQFLADVPKGDETPIFRTLNKNRQGSGAEADGQVNLYASENFPAKPVDVKTSRFNLVLDAKPEQQIDKDLVSGRKSMFHRTLDAGSTSCRPDRPSLFRKHLNKSVIESTPLGAEEAPLPVRGVSSSNIPRSCVELLPGEKPGKPLGDLLPVLDFSRRSQGGDELVKLFSETVIHGPVKTLDLSHNGIGDLDLKKILKTLVDLRFWELRVDGNRLTKLALDYVLSYANYNSALKLVSLRDNDRIDEDSSDVRARLKELGRKGVHVRL